MSLLSKSASARAGSRPDLWRRLWVSLILGALIGMAVAVLGPGPFLSAWLAAVLLSIFSVFFLITAWVWAGRGRLLAGMIALAFILRLGMGVGLSLALPHWGYAEKEQQAGYLFKDAFYRDTQSWNLAQSGQPLWVSFRDEFATDQYGGLLALSALVYRYLSPDAQRPFLLLILGAFFAALGVPFLLQATRLRWPGRIAGLATWIYILYPDAVFFGSSQMREPFLVGLSAIAFWAVLGWDWRKKSIWFALIASLLGMALISSRIAAAVAGFLTLLFLLEYIVARPDPRWKIAGWAGLAVGLVLLLGFSWEWFRSSTAWDVKVTESDSGWVAKVIDEASEKSHLPREQVAPVMTAAYGIARPVLPAAVAQDAKSMLWKVIGVVRSLGWYILAPFLVYGFFAVWREPDPAKRRRLVWLVTAVFLWLIIASARGGGDSVDNPRYRSLFIPWLALLAAWAVDWALVHRDVWLWRFLAVEAIFLAFFTNWYFSRYYKIWGRLSIWNTAYWIIGLSALVLIGGWVWDRWRARKFHFLAGVK